MTTPLRWSTDLFVNGSGAASEPQVTALADGRFVVAWCDTTHQEVRGQILNADGSLHGAQFTINSVPAGEQQVPNITALADGRFVAVWTDQSVWLDNGENADLYGQIFSIDGAKIGAAFKVNDGISVPTVDALVQPSITTLSDGGFAVAWRDYVPADGVQSVQVWVARFDAAGTRVGTLDPIDLTQDVANAKPTIQALAGGSYVIAWTEATVTNAINLHAMLVGSDGSRTDLGNIGSLHADAENVVQIEPNLTRLSDGGFVVTWKVNDWSTGVQAYGVWARVFDANGSARSAPFEVSPISGAEIDPVVTALKDGRFIVSWADSQAYGSLSTEVKSQAYSANGAKDGETITVHTPDGANDRMPSITTLVDGRVVISWWHDGEPTIRAQIIDPRESGIALSGTGLNDDYVGTRFSDDLRGGEGNDVLQGGAAADYLDGGNGFDFVSFSASLSGVTASLGNGSSGDAAGDTYASIEGLIGSGFADIFYGSGAAVLEGRGGHDTFWVSGSDTVVEAQGGGTDTVIASGHYALRPDAEVEILKLASPSGKAAYRLTGSEFANTISGNAGKNVLKGLGGADVLKGGFGNDALYGGAGKDTFVFETKPHKTQNVDRLYDFIVRDDSVYLDNKAFTKVGKKGSFAKPVKLAKDAFTIGKKAADAEDRIIYDNKSGVLYYDADGTGGAAQVKFATLSKNLKMTYADFFVI